MKLFWYSPAKGQGFGTVLLQFGLKRCIFDGFLEKVGFRSTVESMVIVYGA
jgi:hypothetical protein